MLEYHCFYHGHWVIDILNILGNVVVITNYYVVETRHIINRKGKSYLNPKKKVLFHT